MNEIVEIKNDIALEAATRKSKKTDKVMEARAGAEMRNASLRALTHGSGLTDIGDTESATPREQSGQRRKRRAEYAPHSSTKYLLSPDHFLQCYRRHALWRGEQEPIQQACPHSEACGTSCTPGGSD